MSQCKDIKEFIIKRAIAPVGEKQEQMLENHLLTCTQCAAFAHKIETLTIFENEMHISPRRAVKRHLMHKMRSSVRDKKSNVLHRVADVLREQPILPKVAVAVMLMLFVFLALPRFEQPGPISNPEYQSAMIDTVGLNVINLNQIIQIVDSQKVGLNLREDTVLAKILYTL